MILLSFSKIFAASYRCPVCNAPKRRFKKYAGSGGNDPRSMAARMKELKSSGGGADTSSAAVLVGVGAVLLAALYFGLNTMYN